MKMTVKKFVNMCTEPAMLCVNLYDTIKGEYIGAWDADRIPVEYEDLEVYSFDTPNKYYICLNV